MSLAVGTITITMSGETPSYGGSGLALALGQRRFTTALAQLHTKMGTPLPAAALSTIQEYANFVAAGANDDASVIVGYFTANAVVTLSGANAHVTSQQLGRDNTGGNPAILAPAAPVDIPIVGGGTLS